MNTQLSCLTNKWKQDLVLASARQAIVWSHKNTDSALKETSRYEYKNIETVFSLVLKPILCNQWHYALFCWNNQSLLLGQMVFLNGCKIFKADQCKHHQSMMCLDRWVNPTSAIWIHLYGITPSLYGALLATGVHSNLNSTISLKQLEPWLIEPQHTLLVLYGLINDTMSPGETPISNRS